MPAMQSPLGRPCNACRERQVRCSRTRPICKACKKYSKARPDHLCTFPTPAPVARASAKRPKRVAVNANAPPARISDGKKGSSAAAGRVGRGGAAAERAARAVSVEVEVPTSSKRSSKPVQVDKVDSGGPTAERRALVPPFDIPPSLILPTLPTFPLTLSQHVTAMPADLRPAPFVHTYSTPVSALLGAALRPSPSRPALTAKQYSLSQHSLARASTAAVSASAHDVEEQPWSLASLLN